MHAILFLLLLASPLLMTFYPETNRYEIIRETGPLLVLGMGTLAWLVARPPRDLLRPTSVPGLLLLLGFILMSTLSFFTADVQSFGFAEVFMLWICFLVYLPLSQEKNAGNKVTWALALTLVASAFIGAKGYLQTDHTRFFGFFYDPLIKADAWPNAFADFFLLTFPFFVLAFYKFRSPLVPVLTAFLLAGFVLSASRGSFLVVPPALTFFALAHLYTHRKLPRLRFRTLGALILTLLLTAIFVKGLVTFKNQDSKAVDLGDRLTFSETEGGNSLRERLEFFEGALALVQENPWFGTGPTSFRFTYQPHQQGFLAISDHAHNIWLKYASERGLPATLFFFAFMVFLFWKTHPFQKHPEGSHALRLAAWTGLVAFFGHQMVDYNLNFVTNALVFWIIVALLASHLPTQRTRLAPVSLFMIALLISAGGLKLASDELTFNRLQTRKQIEDFNPLLPSYEWYEKFGSVAPELKILTYQKQLEVNPMDSTVWIFLGEAYEADGDLTKAREAYEMAIHVNPKNSFLPYLRLASLLATQGDTAALQSLADQITPYFEEYQMLYDKNLHFTQATHELENMHALQILLP